MSGANTPVEHGRRLPRLGLGMGRLILLLMFTVGTTVLGIYQVSSQYQLVRLGYVIDQDLFEHRRLVESNKRLDLSIASHKHPAVVTSFAKDRLDMHEPRGTEEFVIPSASDAVSIQPKLHDPTPADPHDPAAGEEDAP